jgi:hypothetical protein
MQINDFDIANKKLNEIVVNENFLQSETDLLREGLLRTHTERFLFATKLYKIQKTMEKFSIQHKAYDFKK